MSSPASYSQSCTLFIVSNVSLIPNCSTTKQNLNICFNNKFKFIYLFLYELFVGSVFLVSYLNVFAFCSKKQFCLSV